MPGDATTAPDASLLARDMALHAGEAAALLKALAHPARLLVLCQLVQGERTVGELQPATGLGASALSQHLAVLRDIGGLDASLHKALVGAKRVATDRKSTRLNSSHAV